MDFEVIWTEPALVDLEAVIQKAVEHDRATAQELREALLESVNILVRFPSIGPIFERDLSRRTREILCRKYRIFYRVRETDRRVEILSVRHGSRREPKRPR